MARLSVFKHGAVAKAKVRNEFFREGLRLKGREVTGIRPETARSNPGQDEAQRKLRGGPLPVLGSRLLG